MSLIVVQSHLFTREPPGLLQLLEPLPLPRDPLQLIQNAAAHLFTHTGCWPIAQQKEVLQDLQAMVKARTPARPNASGCLA